jgi:hypothetical protein
LQIIADPKKREALIAYLKVATEGISGSDAPPGKVENETKKQGSKEQ